jgi:hypothetical protein
LEIIHKVKKIKKDPHTKHGNKTNNDDQMKVEGGARETNRQENMVEKRRV